MAAVAAATKIRALNMMPLFALGTTMATYTAQNVGAGRTDRVLSGVRYGLVIAAGFSVAMATVNILWGGWLAGLFFVEETPAIAMAGRYLLYVGLALPLLGLMLVLRNTLQGLGLKKSPTVSSALELLSGLLCARLLVPAYGFTGICLINPISWLLSGVPLYITFFGFLRQAKKGGLPR